MLKVTTAWDLNLHLTYISRESHSGIVCNSSRKIRSLTDCQADRTSCAFHCHGVVNKLFQPFVVRLDVRARGLLRSETCDKVNGEGAGASIQRALGNPLAGEKLNKLANLKASVELLAKLKRSKYCLSRQL